MLSCRLASGPLWLWIYLFLWWFLLVIFGLFLLHCRYELPCQDKLPEFHCTPILGCIRVLWLVFHPLGLGLDKALCDWNSVTVYQFGFLIPKDYKQALQLDEQNGNSKWQDATKLEMDQVNEYKVFQDHGKAKIDPRSRKVSNTPEGYQKIRVPLIFAVKHDGRHKVRQVARGHLTPDPIESIYSLVVSIRSLRLVIFLAKLNNLEVWGAGIGNAYLEAKTKENYMMLQGQSLRNLKDIYWLSTKH